MKILALCLSLVGLATQSQLFDQAPIIEQVNAQKSTWTAGHNSYFENRSLEEIKGLMGTILETPEHMKLAEKHIEPLKDIPESFDSATAWPKCESIKEVRDQSTCGSCWAFGAAQAMSDRLCIASDQKDQTRVSAQDILSCCTSCGFGCNGGFPPQAWNYFKRSGVVTGGLYDDKQWCSPYDFAPCDHHTEGKYKPCGPIQPTPQCETQCVPESVRIYDNDKWYADSVYSVPSSEDKIQTEIMTNGPIEVSFTVYGDFLTYKSGIYARTTGSPIGGHAVKMVGWGVENGNKYWKIANSWNEDWGEAGFFRIKRGTNECGIESQGVAGIVKMKESQ